MTRSGAPEISVTAALNALNRRFGAVLIVAGLAAGCSMPISMPLASIAAADKPVLVTGSVSTEVVDTGVAERVGSVGWAALKSALVSAAELDQDGQAFAWKSPAGTQDSGMEGTVTAIDAFFDEGGAICRRLAITAVAYARTDSFVAEACRTDGGGWNVSPSDKPAR